MKNIYVLKDLSHITGHSIHTLKYYSRIGLLEEIGRSPATNFRYFDDSSVRRLKNIRELRVKGFSLKEISEELKTKHS